MVLSKAIRATVVGFLGIALLGLGWGGGGLAGLQMGQSPVVLTALLTASQEIPVPMGVSPQAIGAGTFLFDPATSTLTFAIAYRGLSDAAIVSHFHAGAPGVTGGVVVTICGPMDADPLVGACPSGTSGFLQGMWTVPADLVDTLLSGGLYFNIHTPQNMPGELRGQLIPQ